MLRVLFDNKGVIPLALHATEVAVSTGREDLAISINMQLVTSIRSIAASLKS